MESTGLPPGISMVRTAAFLASVAAEVGAYKTARLVYEKMHELYLPGSEKVPAMACRKKKGSTNASKHNDHTLPLQAVIEAAALSSRSQPFEDHESLMPVCPRCATVNPVLSAQGDACLNCGAEFVRCFASFRVLPLVAFETTVPADKV